MLPNANAIAIANTKQEKQSGQRVEYGSGSGKGRDSGKDLVGRPEDDPYWTTWSDGQKMTPEERRQFYDDNTFTIFGRAYTGYDIRMAEERDKRWKDFGEKEGKRLMKLREQLIKEGQLDPVPYKRLF